MTGVSANDVPTMGHPLIDEVGDGFVVARTSARVVHLHALRAGLFADAAAAGLRVITITSEASRMTFPALQAVRLFGGAWVIPARDGFRLAGTDSVVGRVEDVFQSAASRAWADEPGSESVPWTQITVSARYVSRSPFRGGRVAEAIASETGAHVASWGALEPAVSAWSPESMTSWAQSRFPNTSRLVVHGPGVSGTIRAWNEPSGVFEETKLVLGGAVSPEQAARVLRRVHGVAQIQFGFACVMRGAPDMTFTSSVPALVEPRAALVGPRAVRDHAFATAELERGGVVERVGHPRTPSLLLSFGRSEAPAWADVAGVVRKFGAETIVSALSGESS